MNDTLRASAATAALVLAIASGAAGAASVPPSQTITPGFNSTNWTLNNNYGNASAFAGGCGGLPGIAIEDARGPTGAGDAYDVAWGIYINNVAFSVPGNVDLTGTTYTAGPATFSGLATTVQYHFVPTSAVARIFVTLQNPTGAPINATVQVPVNFGSDGSTTYVATSSGDAAVTNADRWIISRDSGPSDPVNLSVFYGPGAAVTPSYTTTVYNCAGSEGVGATFNLTVPAGGTRALMMFAGLGGVEVNDNTVASAQASASFFNSIGSMDPDWLAGLSNTQRSQVANWSVGPGFTSCQAEGYKGEKLKLCQLICEVPQPQSVINTWLRLWALKIGGTPPCAGGGSIPTSLVSPLPSPVAGPGTAAPAPRGSQRIH